METITFENIKIEQIPFKKIISMTITHSVNNHATASVMGEVDYKEGTDCLNRIDESTGVKITTTAKDQPSVLFCGIIANANLDSESEYATLSVDLVSTSMLLDIQKNKKSFQNTSKTHEEILKQALGGSAGINFAVSDRPIGSLVMQYNETNWEFTKRMASVFSAPIVANIASPKPYITVGLPQAARTVSAEQSKQSVSVKGIKSTAQSGAGQGSAMGISSYAYAYVGDNISSGGTTQRIRTISSTLTNGILVSTYAFSRESGFVQPIIYNTQASGKMFSGTVQAVEKDKVQVHIVDIDSSYDGGGSHWFPYSTAYSSSDGSGFYCMPEVGDTVRVFFPSNKEENAFAASSANVSPLDNPKHKKWKTPGGKEILLTEEGLFIICKENKIFINMIDEEGISIFSDKDINICSSSNINLQANGELSMYAQNNLLLGTAESYIDITKDNISLAAKNVIIN
jgi:hypothetical protein